LVKKKKYSEVPLRVGQENRMRYALKDSLYTTVSLYKLYIQFPCLLPCESENKAAFLTKG